MHSRLNQLLVQAVQCRQQVMQGAVTRACHQVLKQCRADGVGRGSGGQPKAVLQIRHGGLPCLDGCVYQGEHDGADQVVPAGRQAVADAEQAQSRSFKGVQIMPSQGLAQGFQSGLRWLESKGQRTPHQPGQQALEVVVR